MSPPRPGYHFTAPAGWINDPLGVTWHDDRYELFFQFNPAATVWAPECRWGQATSADLVRWREPRTALEPAPEETGCWSGSLVVPEGQPPVIVYTSVLAGSLPLGRVALATGDASWHRWTPEPTGPVLLAPPPELGIAHFRDPFVWPDGGRWRMAVGAGRRDGRPAVLAYSSPDLRAWTFDGVLAEPPDGASGMGAVWECPQLFPFDGAWALLVSAWDEGPGCVLGAVGDLDGGRFTARAWRPVAPDPLYATTTFADRAGRRCALSWLRDPGPAEGAWAGTLSVPWLLERDGDRIAVRPHPDVDTLRTDLLVADGPRPLGPPGPVLGPFEPHLDVEIELDPAARAEIAVTDADRDLITVPLETGARVLVDAGVVEVFAGGGVAAAHVPATGGPVTLRLAGEGVLRRLAVHGMAPVLG